MGAVRRAPRGVPGQHARDRAVLPHPLRRRPRRVEGRRRAAAQLRARGRHARARGRRARGGAAHQRDGRRAPHPPSQAAHDRAPPAPDLRRRALHPRPLGATARADARTRLRRSRGRVHPTATRHGVRPRARAPRGGLPAVQGLGRGGARRHLPHAQPHRAGRGPARRASRVLRPTSTAWSPNAGSTRGTT